MWPRKAAASRLQHIRMSERLFRFKQFAVSHSASAMKVGTDGVSLGAWAPCGGRVLDAGCGCGLIGLMAAQRGAQSVMMVDIDAASAAEARTNALASPWAERVGVVCADYLTFESERKFDCIISNPPFFATGLQAPDGRRAAARHDDAMPPEPFMRRSAALLAPEGRLSVILPPDREEEWTFAARLAGLYPRTATELLTKPDAPPRRVMLTFGRDEQAPTRTRLALNSDEYKRLTEPFYL